MRLGATVLATTALASGLAFATPAFADSTVAAVKPHDGGCSAYRTGGGFKISACITYQKKGKYKGKVLSYLDVRGVPSKKKKCQILGQTYKPGRPISKLKHFSCTKGNKI